MKLEMENVKTWFQRSFNQGQIIGTFSCKCRILALIHGGEREDFLGCIQHFDQTLSGCGESVTHTSRPRNPNSNCLAEC